jgi:hypothetical protein
VPAAGESSTKSSEEPAGWGVEMVTASMEEGAMLKLAAFFFFEPKIKELPPDFLI